jgi:hypothetical protein
MKAVKGLYLNMYSVFFDVFAEMARVHSLHADITAGVNSGFDRRDRQRDDPVQDREMIQKKR